MVRIEQWLLYKEPPKYPFPISGQLSAQGEKLYAQYCANCHGRNGRDFNGDYVGDIVPIDKIGTDRHRLDSYTEELAAVQNTLYAGYPWRFSHFRKTFGYVNLPLDGVWLRAPYLHNGSVPTLRDLLEPAARRPALFYRGYDVYDPAKVGFVTSVARSEYPRGESEIATPLRCTVCERRSTTISENVTILDWTPALSGADVAEVGAAKASPSIVRTVSRSARRLPWKLTAPRPISHPTASSTTA